MGTAFDALGSAKTDKSFAYTADFLAAIFTWGGVGYLIDRLAGTGPVLMVIGFIIGNTAGIYLLYIRAREADKAGTTVDPTANPATGAEPPTTT